MNRAAISKSPIRYGAKPEEDCVQLWRRVVFNILISNSDDHLRNHGFLYGVGGWRLTPAYDLNPVPVDIKPRVLTTAIDEADDTASLDLAYQVAEHFGLKPDKARAISSEVGAVVKDWRAAGKRLGLSAAEIDRMASAFEHAELKKEFRNTIKPPYGGRRPCRADRRQQLWGLCLT